MLNSGAIQPSQSVWCNTVVLVWKKVGSLHFCIDVHHLNAYMKKDSYPLPRIQEALESLVGAGHFSCLDLKSKFLQIKMDKLLKPYTTFTISNLGFFKCDCMPFGLYNMPAMFQRLMQNFLRELNLTYCLIYLYDIIIFSQTVEEYPHCLHFWWWIIIYFDVEYSYSTPEGPRSLTLWWPNSLTTPVHIWICVQLHQWDGGLTAWLNKTGGSAMEHPYLTHQIETFDITHFRYVIYECIVLHCMLCENEYKWSFNFFKNVLLFYYRTETERWVHGMTTIYPIMQNNSRMLNNTM